MSCSKYFKPHTTRLLTATYSTKLPEANTAMDTPPTSQSSQSLPLYSLLGSPITLKSFFMTSFHYNQGWSAFYLALDGLLKSTILTNLSSFIYRIWPSNLNLSFFIVLENKIELHFSFSLLFKIAYSQSVRYPKQYVGKFMWETSSKYSSIL